LLDVSIMGSRMFAYGRVRRAHGTLRSDNRSGGGTSVLSRDPARNRPPTDRPLDIVGLELLLCVSQALLAGILLSMAADLGGDARAAGLPVPGLTAVLGLSVGTAWLWWLVGGSGWPMAAIDFAVALLTGALWLLSLQDSSVPHIDPWVGLVGLACALYGIVAGAFLPGPRRGHWKDGESRPRRGLPQTRTSPARFSPPVQKVVDERLASVALPRISLAAVRTRGDKAAGGDASLAAASPADPPAPADNGPAADQSLAEVHPGIHRIGSEAGSPGPEPISVAGALPLAEPSSAIGPVPAAEASSEDEPLSVAAMRLSTAAALADEAPGPDDEETVPFPIAEPEVVAGDTEPDAGDEGPGPDA